MIEIWKDIIDYESLYQVSNFGRIRSLNKTRVYKNTIRNIKSKILKPGNCLGYQTIILCKNNIKSNNRLHRLIAKTFIPNLENKPFVNHIDGNKSNNNINNLEWVTAQENTLHSINILKTKSNKGKTWENHNFTIEECLKMIQYYKEGLSFRKISNIFNSNHKTISKIIRNQKYNSPCKL